MTVINAAAQLLDMIVKAEIVHDETVAEIRKRAERAEAVVSAIPWQSLLDIYESGQVSDQDDDALGVFLGRHIPGRFYSKSKSKSEE